MHRIHFIAIWLCMFLLVGCPDDGSTGRTPGPTPEVLKDATVIDYVDSDAFDVLLEAALNRQDSIIVVQTSYAKAEWKGRLNGWIAAWNAGGKVQRGEGLHSKRVKIMTLSAVTNLSKIVIIELPPDTAKEIRKFLQGEIDRIERLAREGVKWWQDEQTKSKRIKLLKPYLFNTPKDPDGNYQIVFYR